MPKMTLEEWKQRQHARWEVHRTEILDDGRARITFIYRANHHAEVCEFDGLDAITARWIWERGRIIAQLERAKSEVARLTEELEEGA